MLCRIHLVCHTFFVFPATFHFFFYVPHRLPFFVSDFLRPFFPLASSFAKCKLISSSVRCSSIEVLCLRLCASPNCTPGETAINSPADLETPQWTTDSASSRGNYCENCEPASGTLPPPVRSSSFSFDKFRNIGGEFGWFGYVTRKSGCSESSNSLINFCDWVSRLNY